MCCCCTAVSVLGGGFYSGSSAQLEDTVRNKSGFCISVMQIKWIKDANFPGRQKAVVVIVWQKAIGIHYRAKWSSGTLLEQRELVV